MATLYGVQATKAAAGTQLIEKGYVRGRVHSMYDSFVLTGDLAAGDVIRMGAMIQGGARIINVILSSTDLDASGGTLDVGWLVTATALEAADQDGFLAAQDVTSAGLFEMASTANFTRPGFQKVFLEEFQAVITTLGDTDATTGTIQLEILFVID